MSQQNLWVVEYSPSQKTVHVDTVSNTIARNSRIIRNSSFNDYMMVGLYETSEMAHKQAERFSEHQAESLGLLVDRLQNIDSMLSKAPYDSDQREESYEDELNENEESVYNTSSHSRPKVIDYSLISGKLLMDLTDEDFELIGIYKGSTHTFPVIYSCSQTFNGSKIYFTPEENSYKMRGYMLREQAEITTTDQLLKAIQDWRKH